MSYEQGASEFAMNVELPSKESLWYLAYIRKSGPEIYSELADMYARGRLEGIPEAVKTFSYSRKPLSSEAEEGPDALEITTMCVASICYHWIKGDFSKAWDIVEAIAESLSTNGKPRRDCSTIVIEQKTLLRVAAALAQSSQMTRVQAEYLLDCFEKISKRYPAETIARMQFFLLGRESLESLQNVGSTEEAIDAIDCCVPDAKERILAEERRSGVAYWDAEATLSLFDSVSEYVIAQLSQPWLQCLSQLARLMRESLDFPHATWDYEVSLLTEPIAEAIARGSNPTDLAAEWSGPENAVGNTVIRDCILQIVELVYIAWPPLYLNLVEARFHVCQELKKLTAC